MEDPNFNKAIAIILPYIEKYKDHENIELEFRVGSFDQDSETFNSFVCKEFYTKIQNVLQTNKSWLSKKKSKTNDYFNDGMRLSVHEDGTKTCIAKSKLCVLDFMFEDTPFDIRVCFSEEKPVKVSKFKNGSKTLYNRKKNRISYLHKVWSYDITTVTTVENTVEETFSEIELDVNNLKEVLKTIKPKYLIHSSLLKIKDLVNMCEKVKDENQLELMNVKEFT